MIACARVIIIDYCAKRSVLQNKTHILKDQEYTHMLTTVKFEENVRLNALLHHKK